MKHKCREHEYDELQVEIIRLSRAAKEIRTPTNAGLYEQRLAIQAILYGMPGGSWPDDIRELWCT
jgi:hypothetical protein